MNIKANNKGDISFAFTFPDLEAERGEIERVANEFSQDDHNVFVEQFMERAKGSPLITMELDMWSMLENTDSYDISPGDWDTVDNHAVAGNPDRPRNWQYFRLMIENEENLHAPIVCQKNGRLHLVSGNTRLMVARALGKAPQILLVNMD